MGNITFLFIEPQIRKIYKWIGNSATSIKMCWWNYYFGFVFVLFCLWVFFWGGGVVLGVFVFVSVWFFMVIVGLFLWLFWGVGWGGVFALFLLVLFYLTLWYNKITKQFRKLKDIKTVLKHNKVNEMVWFITNSLIF